MDTDNIIKVEDTETSCGECIFCDEQSCVHNETIEKLNEIHGKCWNKNHHYEYK